MSIVLYSIIFYFNPRSHEGSDSIIIRALSDSEISIHAPTKGATFIEFLCAGSSKFQSTLPRRERLMSVSAHLTHPDFNPRSHEGSDEPVLIYDFCPVISIHAPTKGATPHQIGFRKPHADFNPRSHEGSDRAFPRNTVLSWIFQSTLPRRERPPRTSFLYCTGYFNPRSHEGSDRHPTTLPVSRYHFNPRSHEGSDDGVGVQCGCFYDFNPRSHEGSDYL